jgi:hypothetical protein
MNSEERTQLDEQGYLIFKNLLSLGQIEALLARLEELWAAEGEQAGEENYIEPGVRRLANLAGKGSLFREIYAHPRVLEVVEAVMGPEVRASMVNARDVPPHTGVRMPFHMDRTRAASMKRLQRAAIWMLIPSAENGRRHSSPPAPAWQISETSPADECPHDDHCRRTAGDAPSF